MDLVALVPAVVGIALSPLVVASVVFLLGHRSGPAPALACAAGWTASIAAGLVVAVLVGERLPVSTGGGSPVQAVVALGAGVLLLVLAVVQWTRRRLPDGAPASSRWSDAVARVGTGHAFGVGVLWFVTNPKALVLVLSAGLELGDGDPGVLGLAVVGVGFAVLSGSTAVLPVGLVLALGDRSVGPLAAMRVAIARWGAVGLVVVLAVVGAVETATGLVGVLS